MNSFGLFDLVDRLVTAIEQERYTLGTAEGLPDHASLVTVDLEDTPVELASDPRLVTACDFLIFLSSMYEFEQWPEDEYDRFCQMGLEEERNIPVCVLMSLNSLPIHEQNLRENIKMVQTLLSYGCRMEREGKIHLGPFSRAELDLFGVALDGLLAFHDMPDAANEYFPVRQAGDYFYVVGDAKLFDDLFQSEQAFRPDIQSSQGVYHWTIGPDPGQSLN